MALNLQNKYPGRFDPVSADYPQGKFKNRSSPTAQDGSYMERDWLNDWNAFFGALLNNANVAPNGTVDTATASQLYDALRVVTGSKYGTAIIGSLVHWPLQQMPQDIFPDLGQVYIPYIGQAFDQVKYPLLKMLHPSGVLPADMRGEFARGWDNGRGVDTGRVLMSAQGDAMRTLAGSFTGIDFANQAGATGVFSSSATVATPAAESFSASAYHRRIDFSTSGVVPTAGEFRSRSIAWNMIVRAA